MHGILILGLESKQDTSQKKRKEMKEKHWVRYNGYIQSTKHYFWWLLKIKIKPTRNPWKLIFYGEIFVLFVSFAHILLYVLLSHGLKCKIQFTGNGLITSKRDRNQSVYERIKEYVEYVYILCWEQCIFQQFHIFSKQQRR